MHTYTYEWISSLPSTNIKFSCWLLFQSLYKMWVRMRKQKMNSCCYCFMWTWNIVITALYCFHCTSALKSFIYNWTRVNYLCFYNALCVFVLYAMYYYLYNFPHTFCVCLFVDFLFLLYIFLFLFILWRKIFVQLNTNWKTTVKIREQRIKKWMKFSEWREGEVNICKHFIFLALCFNLLVMKVLIINIFIFFKILCV